MSRLTQDPSGALTTLAREKYDLIIVALPRIDIVYVRRAQVPARAVLLDRRPTPGFRAPHEPKNVQGSVYRAEEAGYLAGYLAALMESRHPGKHVISAVGGIPYMGVNRWTVGYKAGARKADPEIAVKLGYSLDFANPAKCRRVAQRQIAEGSGVVFNVLGHLRPRHAPRGEGRSRLGGRRRHRSGVPRPPRAHERGSQARRGRRGRGAAIHTRRAGGFNRDHRLQPPQRRRRARTDQPQGAAPSASPPWTNPRSHRRWQDPRSAAYNRPPRPDLSFSFWVPTQTAPSPAATETGCVPDPHHALREPGRRVDPPKEARVGADRPERPACRCQLRRDSRRWERNRGLRSQRGRVQVPDVSVRGPVPD